MTFQTGQTKWDGGSNISKEMLTSALKILVKNLIKESFYRKIKKTINFFEKEADNFI